MARPSCKSCWKQAGLLWITSFRDWGGVFSIEQAMLCFALFQILPFFLFSPHLKPSAISSFFLIPVLIIHNKAYSSYLTLLQSKFWSNLSCFPVANQIPLGNPQTGDVHLSTAIALLQLLSSSTYFSQYMWEQLLWQLLDEPEHFIRVTQYIFSGHMSVAKDLHFQKVHRLFLLHRAS